MYSHGSHGFLKQKKSFDIPEAVINGTWHDSYGPPRGHGRNDKWENATRDN